MFSNESELVESALPLLNEFFNKGQKQDFLLLREPKGLFGIPDLIIYNGKIISIEFKIKDWKRAIKQAFRYKNFSHASYVFLDERHIKSAANNIDYFKKYNIGLCGVSRDKIQLYYQPREGKPYSEDQKLKVLRMFNISQ